MAERNDLFDETLDVLPLHWRGEPFSYEGRHFSARDVIARPRPVQNPIPIWIGGNSKLSRRRVAERAHGWIPMSGSAELSATTRTPNVGSVAELARMIAGLRETAAAGGRSDEIDVAHSYPDHSIASPADNTERHRATIAAMEDAGVTWLIVSSGTREVAATLEFLEGFGATYLAS